MDEWFYCIHSYNNKAFVYKKYVELLYVATSTS